MPRKAMKTYAGHTPTISRGTVAALRKLFIFILSFAVAVPPSWTVSAIIHQDRAEASTYAAGYSKYQKGDFKGAEVALRQSLRKKMNRATMGKTYKLLGICQYMLGNKNGATVSFRRAIQLVPATRVSPSEVLDETVVGFFNGVKSKFGKAAQAKQATKVKSTKPAPAPAQPSSSSGSKPQKKTFLKVLSNAPNASIAIDGILAGQANSLINTDPGKVTIEVTAPGYRPKTVSVNVTANQENTVTVTLLKPQPKPKPKPKPKVKPQPKQKPKQNLAKVKKKKKKKGNKYAPDPGGDMFAGNGGGGGPPGPDLASQFDADAGGYGAPPGYSAPPPGYAAPPGYGAPPPVYYAPPPPTYYAPPPPTYYAPPPPPPPPPADPYAGGGYVDPNGGAPVDNAPDPAAPPSAGENGGSSGNNLFISLLPFGAGQFQNGSVVLGLFFLGAEGAAIYYYMKNTKDADAFAASANTYIKENCQSEDSDEEVCQKFQADSTAYVSDLRKKAQMGIAGFVGLWVVGAAEAIINEPKPEPATKKKKQRRYGGFAYTPTPDGHHFSLLGKQSERSLFAYDLGFNVVPASVMSWTPEYGSGFGTSLGQELKEKNELSLSLTLEF